MFVVAGVTGHTGAVVAEALLARSMPVRVLVRDARKGEPWRQRGAAVAVAALEDTAALKQAFAGATAAYLLLPPRLKSATPLEDNRRVAHSLADAVAAAKLGHVVLLSSIGAQLQDGTGPIQSLHDAEWQLAATGCALTIVRAAYFMENWSPVLGATADGLLPTFLPPSLRIPMVASRDIGLCAADALVEGGKGRRVVELSGPREYSADDVAGALAEILGRPVSTQRAPLDAVVPTFTAMGVAPAVAALYREMFAGIGNGRVAWAGGTARVVRGATAIGEVLRALLAE
jgi:uncharacterized protein YbjT (DUF2867 family)